MSTQTEILSRIALNLVSGIGPRSINKLIDVYGSASTVFETDPADLERRTRVSLDTFNEAVKIFRNGAAESEFEKAQEMGIRIVTSEDSEYPQLLHQIHDPPPLLYVSGSLKRIEPAVAVVGARQSSIYGVEVAKKISSQLVSMGFCVISGLARGIDTAAHKGAITSKGQTIAFIGSGHARLYPSENRKLAAEISGSGAIVSEFPLNTEAFPVNFPRRNRLISGCSLGVVVVEARLRSGSLITAKQALDQGRTVFAVPGRVDSPLSRGPHELIRQGARLLEGIEDILDEFQFSCPHEIPSSPVSEKLCNSLGESEKVVWSELGKEPVGVEDLIYRTGMEAAVISRTLLCLEMKRFVKKLPGMRFIKALTEQM